MDVDDGPVAVATRPQAVNAISLHQTVNRHEFDVSPFET